MRVEEEKENEIRSNGEGEVKRKTAKVTVRENDISEEGSDGEQFNEEVVHMT